MHFNKSFLFFVELFKFLIIKFGLTIFLVFISLNFIYLNFSKFKYAKNFKNWKKTTGILKLKKASTPMGAVCNGEFIVEYTVDNRKYSSNINNFSPFEKTIKMKTPKTVNGEITIFHDPNQPSKIVLPQNVSPFPFFTSFIISIFLIFASFYIIQLQAMYKIDRIIELNKKTKNN